MVNRPYRSGQSIAYVAKFGLNALHHSISKPAKHPAHLLKMTSVLQNLHGAIGWDAVRPFRPLPRHLPEERIRQLAQMLLRVQPALGAGEGWWLTDINSTTVPKHFQTCPPSAGGVETGNLRRLSPEAKSFRRPCFGVYMDGDS